MRWQSSGGLLWVCGKAGSGKSVLAKTIQREFSEKSRNSSHIQQWFVCDWFYSSSLEIGKAHLSMLRALLYEILRYSEPLFDAMIGHYRSRFDDGSTPNVSWSTEALGAMLRDISGCPLAPDILAVIDGLDESENGETLSENALDVMGMLYNLSRVPAGRIRCIVLSRPEPRIWEKFRHCHRIVMDKENRGDINTIIEVGLQSIIEAWKGAVGINDEDTASAVDLSDMRTYLNENASGVVLWVTLVLQQLQLRVDSEYGFSLDALDKVMRGLPIELGQLYSKILSDLEISADPQRLSVAKKILTWIIGSQPWAPLQLQHLREAIALPDDNDILCQSGVDIVERRRLEIGPKENWDIFRRHIHRYCGPLLEVHNGDSTQGMQETATCATSTVQLLHKTVRNFLEDEERSGVLHVDTASAKNVVRVESFKYLGFNAPPPTFVRLRRRQEQYHSLFLPWVRAIIPKHLLQGQELQGQEYQGLLLRLPRSWSKSHTAKGLAQKDYLSSRPLAAFALQIVHQSLEMDDSVLITMLHGDDTMNDPRTCFVPFWFADTYLSMEPHLGYPIIQLFIRHCCETGQLAILETAFELTKVYLAEYRSRLRTRVATNAHFGYSVLKGATDAFIAVASKYPHCRHPVANSLLREYRKCYELLENSSSVGVNTVAVLSHPDDPIMESAERDKEPRAKLHSMESIVRADDLTDPHATHSYEHHCRHQIHSVELDGHVKSVSVLQIYNALRRVLDWSQSHHGPGENPLPSLQPTLMGWWMDDDDDRLFFLLSSRPGGEEFHESDFETFLAGNLSDRAVGLGSP